MKAKNKFRAYTVALGGALALTLVTGCTTMQSASDDRSSNDSTSLSTNLGPDEFLIGFLPVTQSTALPGYEMLKSGRDEGLQGYGYGIKGNPQKRYFIGFNNNADAYIKKSTSIGMPEVTISGLRGVEAKDSDVYQLVLTVKNNKAVGILGYSSQADELRTILLKTISKLQ